MIVILKLTLFSPISFISNLDAKKDLVLKAILMHVPKISLPSTYKHIMKQSSFIDFVYTHLTLT